MILSITRSIIWRQQSTFSHFSSVSSFHSNALSLKKKKPLTSLIVVAMEIAFRILSKFGIALILPCINLFTSPAHGLSLFFDLQTNTIYHLYFFTVNMNLQSILVDIIFVFLIVNTSFYTFLMKSSKSSSLLPHKTMSACVKLNMLVFQLQFPSLFCFSKLSFLY